jgi:enterochelin esterase-like enzyme
MFSFIRSSVLPFLFLVQYSALGQSPSPQPKWQPKPLTDLREALKSDPGKAEAIAWACLGKRNLQEGKAVCKNTDFLVAWGLVLPTGEAVVEDSQGKLIGKLQPVGSHGLRVLLQELPNFTALHYKLKAAGKLVLAGDVKIENYLVPSEAQPRDGVPQGRIERFQWNESKIYPGTERQVSVYIPAQYDAAQPPALMVWQDGTRHSERESGLRAPTVMDNLIADKAMPVAISVFIDPGRFSKQPADGKPGNRSFEYDSLGPLYSRLLLEEILPQVKQRYGLVWSEKPEDHAIAGGSSGGICAFTAAWEQPDQFRKVLSWVGSFVDLRGGHVYPALIRQRERLPLRIYLLDGANDLDNPFGHWPIANQNMAASLKFMGYDYRFDYGQCFHGSKGMAASLPDALRWLWRK